MYRLFISINLTTELLDSIRATQDALKGALADYPLRWTRPEGIHLTLKFLGDTDPARVETIGRALQQVVEPRPPFELSVGGLGCFPNPRKTSVLWIGVHDPEDHLRELAAAIDEAMAGLGYQRERRAYTGHLTLARVQRYAKSSERRALGEQLPSLGVPETLGVLPATSVHLMRSQLKPDGAVYSSLADIRLSS